MLDAGITDVDINIAGPFRHRRLGDDYLLTNDFGDWIFLSAEEFRRFVEGELADSDELYERLNAKRFIHGTVSLNEAAERYRGRRWFLDHGPRTHSLALGDGEIDGASMSAETVDRAVDCAFMSTSPDLVFAITGSAPLNHWASVERVVSYVENKNRLARKRVSFILHTELDGMTEEQVAFVAEHGVQVHAHIQGSDATAWAAARTLIPALHAAYDGAGHDSETLHVVLCHTATSDTGNDLAGIVDLGVELGCKTVSFEPAPHQPFITDDVTNPRQLDAWLDSYVEALDRCLAQEAEGQPVAESTARVLAQRILGDRASNDVRYRSPAADGIGELAYHWDGRVFSSEIGRQIAESTDDEMFKIGELRIHGYHDMITSPTVRALVLATLVEGQPACNDLAYAPFGGLSPAECYAEHGSIHGRPAEHSSWLRLVRTMDTLFGHLRRNDDAKTSALHRWSEPT